MINIGSWSMTSFEIPNSNESSSGIDFLSKEGFGEEDNGKYIIYREPTKLFCPDNYITEKEFLSDIIDYFEDVDFSNDLKIISNVNDFKVSINNYSQEVFRYSDILSVNHIKTDLKISNFSVNLLTDLRLSGHKISVLKKFFILLMIANYCSLDFDKNTAEFSLKHDDRQIKYDYNFVEENARDIAYLEQIYQWVINEEGYENSYNQKLGIIRSILIKNNNFTLNNNIIQSARSIFQRIINQETERYFDQVNQLKNDFLTITERENSIYQSLHLKLLGWLSALGLTIFDTIKNYNGQNIFDRILNSNSEKTNLTLLLLIIALCTIIVMYILETRKNQDEFHRLKVFYTKSLLFSEEDFTNKVKFNSIDRRYISVIFWFLCILLSRLFLTNLVFISFVVIFTILEYLAFKNSYIDRLCKLIDKEEE